MDSIQPGARMVISNDIFVDGHIAFGSGEEVTVQAVSPNLERPEHKYVVASARTGRRFQLRGADFRPVAPPSGNAPRQGIAPMGAAQAPGPKADPYGREPYAEPFALIAPAYSDSVQPTTAHREYVKKGKRIENIISVVLCLAGIAVFIFVSMLIGIGLFVVGIGLLGYTNRHY